MWLNCIREDISVGNRSGFGFFCFGLEGCLNFHWLGISWRSKHSCRISNGLHFLSIGKCLSVSVPVLIELSLQTFEDHDIPLFSLILRLVNEVVIESSNNLPLS